MPETGPEHPVTYRQEIAGPFYHQFVRSMESCVIVGMAGAGLTRLVDFLVSAPVQQHYLAGMEDAPLLLKVDCNRSAEFTDWGLYEILLTSLLEGCSGHSRAAAYRAELTRLRSEVITSRDALLALRNLELAAGILINDAKLNLYLVVSEFDDFYRSLPALTLTNLRALRNAHRYTLNFAICMHQFPGLLRPELDDKLSARIVQNLLVMGPYQPEDAARMVLQLKARKRAAIAPALVDQILHLSGCHAGLIQGIVDALGGQEHTEAGQDLLAWLAGQPQPWLECEKIWNNLSELEQQGLLDVAQGELPAQESRRVLVDRCLITADAGKPEIFSPLLAQYIRQKAWPGPATLVVDERAHLVKIGAKVIPSVSPLVFKLLLYLYQHRDEACKHDDIIAAVYPGEHDVSNEALVSLVRQARQIIRPFANPDLFLHTVRGIGYKLVDTPASEIKRA